MTNYERGKKLIKDAEEYKKDAIKYFKKEDWNKVIRRAQESFELYLKGVMKIIGIEVPKIHDVGRVFVEGLKKRNISVSEDTTEKIIYFSSLLSEKRAPAFYREEEYRKEDAEEAIEILKFISNFIKKLLKEINHE